MRLSVLLHVGFFLLLGIISQRTQAQSPTLAATDRTAITEVLMAQQAAWNQGEIEAFMQGYWQSDSLTFVGSRGVTYGWQATLAGYQRRYPDRETMGELSFGIEQLSALGPDAALLIGTWRLTRAEDSPGGYFTLIWRRIHDHWVIVSDHTSAE
jgi:hypothetical protein